MGADRCVAAKKFPRQGQFGNKDTGLQWTEFVGLCRKQVEGEKTKVRRCQALRAARSR